MYHRSPDSGNLQCSARGVKMAICRNVKRFRGGLVFKAHRLVYHSTLGLRVIKKRKNLRSRRGSVAGSRSCFEQDCLIMLWSVIISPLVARKVNLRLPGKGNSNSHGARPVHQIISMIKWIRTSSLSIKNSLSLHPAGCWIQPPFPCQQSVCLIRKRKILGGGTGVPRS